MIEHSFLQPDHLVSVLRIHSEFGIGSTTSGLCGALSALSTSINTGSISSTVADASPAAWLGENYTSLFMLHPRISAVDCIGTRDRQFTRSTIFSLLVLGISANFALGVFARFPWGSLCTIFALSFVPRFAFDIVARFASDRCAHFPLERCRRSLVVLCPYMFS